jgi:tetratricopeptide (TPR) repeat protein
VLALLAIYLYVTRSRSKIAAPVDASMASTPPADAATWSPPPPEDAALPVGVVDAAPEKPPVDAMVVPPPKVNPAAQAKVLYDDAKQRFEEHEYVQALNLVDQSLKLRRTARSLLLRGQTLQRLGRIDEALSALSAAEPIAAANGVVALREILEWRARILWSVRRRDEARTAMEAYLEKAPDGPAAAQFRKWLED